MDLRPPVPALMHRLYQSGEASRIEARGIHDRRRRTDPAVRPRLVTFAHRRLAVLAQQNAHFYRCLRRQASLGWRPGGTSAHDKSVTDAKIEGNLSMDDTRFDALTRRRFGLASGGLLATLLGLAGTGDRVAAKHKHRKHQKHKRRCQQLGQLCFPDDKDACCGKLHCGPVPSLAPVPVVPNRGVILEDVCCQRAGGKCRPDKNDCCAPLGCAPASKRCEL